MPRYFSNLWTREEVEQWPIEPVMGSYSNLFSKRGVKKGDVIYLWAYFDETLRLLNRFTVGTIEKVSPSKNSLGKKELAIAKDQSDIQLSVYISPDDIKRLRFMPDGKPPTYRKSPYSHRPDAQTFRGIREITSETAALLDTYLMRQPSGLKACDLAEPPERVATLVQRIVRDTSIARELKSQYRNVCQICKKAIYINAEQSYSEVHHLRPLGKDHRGLDVKENMMVLCPNHHVMFDFGVPLFKTQNLLVINGKEVEFTDRHGVSRESIEYYMEHIYIGRDHEHNG